jgi:hypothetical protein
MNGWVDDALVGLVLGMSLAYALFSLGPRTLRRRFLAAMAAGLLRVPPVLGLHRLALRLQGAALTSKGSCGGCDDCAAQTAPQTGSPVDAAAAEIKVPLASIGKRRREPSAR